MSGLAEKTIKLLNILGQCYIADGQFDEDNEVKQDIDNEVLMDILNTKYPKGHYDIKSNKCICFKTWFLEEKSKEEIVYDTVMLKLPNDYWHNGKPHLLGKNNEVYEWYNDCSEEKSNISSRPYITINIAYEKITISSREKGSPITFEDVLFATRGMCLDEFRCVTNMDYGGYKLKARMGNSLLVLEPEIENIEH